jgi:hypothetical protein
VLSGERVEASADRAGLVELFDHLFRLCGCQEHRRPAGSRDEPALE